MREDGRINGEENGKWERRQAVAGGSINKLSLSLSVSVCLCLCIRLFVSLCLGLGSNRYLGNA